MKLTDLSRAVSHALRHEPWLYELELDERGWVPVEQLLVALRRDEAFAGAERADLAAMIAAADKARHELDGDRIRALYGHSTPERLSREAAAPPATLYHGTAAATAIAIGTDGLRPMGRQYVHLSTDIATARQVGARKGKDVVLLTIDAGGAHAAGIPFYRGNDAVWLADTIPAAFIRT